MTRSVLNGHTLISCDGLHTCDQHMMHYNGQTTTIQQSFYEFGWVFYVRYYPEHATADICNECRKVLMPTKPNF